MILKPPADRRIRKKIPLCQESQSDQELKYSVTRQYDLCACLKPRKSINHHQIVYGHHNGGSRDNNTCIFSLYIVKC